MENFDRVGASPFTEDGYTQDVDICFSGGSRLKVYGGSPYTSFRLKFSNLSNDGWWVSSAALDALIAELLYIRRDIQRLRTSGIVAEEERVHEVEEEDCEEEDSETY